MTLNRCASRALIAVAIFASTATPAAAQQGLADRCASVASQTSTAGYCATVAQLADLVPGRIAIAAAGGNPVPGTGSTLGLSLGSFPPFSVDGRLTMVWTGVPAASRIQPGESEDAAIKGWHADGSLGLFSGFSPFATVGGVGAIDLLGSVGNVDMPEAGGLNDEGITTWGLGARVGVTRESFTAPGVSLSVMYRDLGEFSYGANSLQGTDAFLHMDETYQWSFRGVAGKRITTLGLTAGLGYDRYGGETLMRIRDGGGIIEVSEPVSAGRWNAFLNGSFTLIVLSATAELGWQGGGETPPGARSDESTEGALFASFAIRIGF